VAACTFSHSYALLVILPGRSVERALYLRRVLGAYKRAACEGPRYMCVCWASLNVPKEGMSRRRASRVYHDYFKRGAVEDETTAFHSGLRSTNFNES
jgi:hypothetical protein